MIGTMARDFDRQQLREPASESLPVYQGLDEQSAEYIESMLRERRFTNHVGSITREGCTVFHCGTVKQFEWSQTLTVAFKYGCLFQQAISQE